MQFAGLTFLLIGILKYFKLSELKIFIASIALNIIGMALSSNVKTGSYVLDQLLGLFILTESESYFPLLHWFIYPAFGMFFGTILKRVTDKKKFYSALLIPTGLVTLIYVYTAACVNQPFFMVLHDLNAVNSISITDVLAQLVCNVFLI